MSFQQEPIFQWLAQYAYQPHVVYLTVVGVMVASGFGFPVPEEVTIISVGLLTYMGANPDLFPPPYEGAPIVHGFEAAVVTLIAVIFADCLVFALGRVFGRRILKTKHFKKVFTDARHEFIDRWLKKYGIYAAFIFRFTPGIRFPAHIMLGMSKFPAWQFASVDGLAAAISVPTQIILIYYLGETILSAFHKFRILILSLIGILILVLLIKNYLIPRFKQRKS